MTFPVLQDLGIPQDIPQHVDISFAFVYWL